VKKRNNNPHHSTPQPSQGTKKEKKNNTTIKWWSLARVAVGEWTGIMYMIPRPFANKLDQENLDFPCMPWT